MKNLLICTDGSNYSQESCRYAAWFAKQLGAKVEVLYVTDLRQFEIPAVADLSGSLGIQPYEGMIAQLQEVEARKAKFVEESAMAIFEAEGVLEHTTFHHETGMLVDAIEGYAERADMILLGKRGENANFATEHLGSMLERIVRASTKPCVVTSRDFRPIYHVAIAYDGGVSCQRALEFMAQSELFRAFDLHVVTVAESHKEDQAAAQLAEAERMMNASGLYPTCQVLSGEAETAIAHYVKSAKIDLLVAGAYGHSRIRKLLIGSTTTELLRRCHVPVLCFR
ncbi:universal stress protein [Flavobacteriaceae bacterium]|jgi:nucleotide-binding universal stress UspA family protein|nr:universal stress protein [Flavobacteriaceae bacterium]